MNASTPVAILDPMNPPSSFNIVNFSVDLHSKTIHLFTTNANKTPQTQDRMLLMFKSIPVDTNRAYDAHEISVVNPPHTMYRTASL